MQNENVVDIHEALRRHAEPAPRDIDPEDWRRYEGYLAEIFASLGLEPDTPGTRDTPGRFLRAMFDATAGYEGDPKLLTVFPSESLRGTARRTSPTCRATRSSGSPS